MRIFGALIPFDRLRTGFGRFDGGVVWITKTAKERESHESFSRISYLFVCFAVQNLFAN